MLIIIWNSCNSESIIITNETCFTKEENKRLVSEGERFAADDEPHRKHVETLITSPRSSTSNGMGSNIANYDRYTVLESGLGRTGKMRLWTN